jgi:alkanesulfonate monooxygenase SsuD/methylene tetrahydromethanopterin reductase-like flavin-dependent oxidoreductase (luciferase family)
MFIFDGKMEVSLMNKIGNETPTFGIMLGPFPPWKQIVEWAKLVESLGFDKLWLPDHFVNPDDKDMGWIDCWSVLTALATQTDKITIGTLVSSMTLRNPAILAHMTLSADHISGGRFELGVGAAGTRKCHEMTGVPRWDPRERSERYEEFVEILHHMLNNEVTTYQGKYYQIQEALMHPRFISKPHPVFNVAAHGKQALRIAARYGDAWNCLGPMKETTPKESSDFTHQCYEYLCESAIKAGRDPMKFGRTFLFGWTSDGPFRSIEAFYDTIERYIEAGINDFCFIYAPGITLWKDQSIASEDLLCKIALEAIPRIRKKL